eukprot:959659-Prymnesium_polylepis.1
MAVEPLEMRQTDDLDGAPSGVAFSTADGPLQLAEACGVRGGTGVGVSSVVVPSLSTSCTAMMYRSMLE